MNIWKPKTPNEEGGMEDKNFFMNKTKIDYLEDEDKIDAPSDFGRYLDDKDIPYASIDQDFIIGAHHIVSEYLCPEALIDEYRSLKSPEGIPHGYKIETISFGK